MSDLALVREVLFMSFSSLVVTCRALIIRTRPERVISIGKNLGQRIAKDKERLREADVVLFLIRSVFAWVPFEHQLQLYLWSSLPAVRRNQR